MTEKLKGFWERVKGWFQKLSKKARILLFSSVALLLIAILALVLILNNKPYVVLFTDLSAEDANAIVGYLEDNGISQYRLENGNTITVPSGLENRLKANIAMQGYPKSGFAYETYRSAVGTMSTESDRDMAYLQDLQDRLAAVIRCFDGVKDAVVNITPEEDRRYILDSNSMTQATAAVTVTMRSGTLTDKQANAIRNLVSRSVKGLSISGDITLVDTQGNSYGGGDSSTMATSDASALKMQLEDQTNQKVRKQILEVLTPFYGAQNIKVTVNSTVDVNRTIGESTTYSQPEWAGGNTGGKGIIGSQIYNQEIVRGDGNAAGGAAGTQGNADINTYMNNNMQVNGDDTYLANSGETNYDNNVQKEQTERVAGYVSDLTVAVTLNSDVPTAMSRNQLLDHIARAAGILPDIQADKISIVSGPFMTNTDNNTGNLPGPGNLPFPIWVLYAAAGGLLLLLILLTLILVLRRKKKKRMAAELNALLESQEDDVTVEPTGVDIMTIKTEKSMELRKTIRQFAEENPEIAAYMLKTWLREEDEQHA